MSEDHIKELIDRLCEDLTKDIKNLSDKEWLMPALVSHITRLSGQPEERVGRFVHSWFTKNSKKK